MNSNYLIVKLITFFKNWQMKFSENNFKVTKHFENKALRGNMFIALIT